MVTQSVIVALDHCSIPNRQPDASASQQGVLLTIRFTDTTGKIDTATFPGCQQGAYHLGDHFPIRYLPADPTSIAPATSSSDVSEGISLTMTLGFEMVLTAAIILIGVLDCIRRWKERRLFAELRRQEPSRRKDH